MTTELTLLLSIFAFVLLAAFLGERGPLATFKEASPRLASRIERDISVGRGFSENPRTSIRWEAPSGSR